MSRDSSKALCFLLPPILFVVASVAVVILLLTLVIYSYSPPPDSRFTITPISMLVWDDDYIDGFQTISTLLVVLVECLVLSHIVTHWIIWSSYLLPENPSSPSLPRRSSKLKRCCICFYLSSLLLFLQFVAAQMTATGLFGVAFINCYEDEHDAFAILTFVGLLILIPTWLSTDYPVVYGLTQRSVHCCIGVQMAHFVMVSLFGCLLIFGGVVLTIAAAAIMLPQYEAGESKELMNTLGWCEMLSLPLVVVFFLSRIVEAVWALIVVVGALKRRSGLLEKEKEGGLQLIEETEEVADEVDV